MDWSRLSPFSHQTTAVRLLWLLSLSVLAIPRGCANETGVQGSLPPLSRSAAAEPMVPAPQPSVPEPAQDSDDPNFVALILSIKPVGWQANPLSDFENVKAQNLPETVNWQPLAQYVLFSDGQKLEMLREFGCRFVLRRDYTRGQRHLIIEVLRFQDQKGAYGAYNLLRQGASTVVKRGDGSSEDDQSITFWQDKFVIRVSATSQEDEESKEVVRTMADRLATGIVNHAGLPPLVVQLPRWERVRGSEKLIMGAAGARHYFSAPYLGNLMLERMKEGVVADYKMQTPHPERLKLLLIDFGSLEAADQAFQAYTQNLSDAHGGRQPSESDPHARLFRVGDVFMLCQLRGQMVAIINGARKKGSPFVLMRQLSN